MASTTTMQPKFMVDWVAERLMTMYNIVVYHECGMDCIRRANDGTLLVIISKDDEGRLHILSQNERLHLDVTYATPFLDLYHTICIVSAMQDARIELKLGRA